MRGFNRVRATSPATVSPFRRGSWAGSAWGTSEIVTAERTGNPLERLDPRVFKRVSKKCNCTFRFLRVSENHIMEGPFLGVFGKVNTFDRECRKLISAGVCARSFT